MAYQKKNIVISNMFLLTVLFLAFMIFFSGCRLTPTSLPNAVEGMKEETESGGLSDNVQSIQTVSSVSTQTSVVCTNGYCQEVTVHQSTEIYCVNGVCEVLHP